MNTKLRGSSIFRLLSLVEWMATRVLRTIRAGVVFLPPLALPRIFIKGGRSIHPALFSS